MLLQHALTTGMAVNVNDNDNDNDNDSNGAGGRLRDGDLLVWLGDGSTPLERGIGKHLALAAVTQGGFVGTSGGCSNKSGSNHSGAGSSIRKWLEKHPEELSQLIALLTSNGNRSSSASSPSSSSSSSSSFSWPRPEELQFSKSPFDQAKKRWAEATSFLEMKRPGPAPLELPPPLRSSGHALAHPLPRPHAKGAGTTSNAQAYLAQNLGPYLDNEGTCACGGDSGVHVHVVGSEAFHAVTVPWIQTCGCGGCGEAASSSFLGVLALNHGADCAAA